MGDDEPDRTGIALRGEPLGWHDLLQVVETAEETGYEAVFVPEIAHREAFASLTGFAAHTSRVRLGSGVAPMTFRDPRATAMAAATLHEISGGRFILGLGSGRVEDRPIELTVSYLEAVRKLLGGDTVRLGGDAAVLENAPGARAIPIYLAALGPRMVELAGRAADGVLLNWCTPERVARAREELARGAERAGRDPREITVAVYVRACLGHEDDQAIPVLRQAVAEYAAKPHYRRQLEAVGLGEEAAAAAKAFEADDPQSVPEALVDAVSVHGSRDRALARFGAYRDAGADLVVAYPVPAMEALSSMMGTVLAAAPAPRVER